MPIGIKGFQKGNMPWNKGTKGVMKSNKTSFKKDNEHHKNWLKAIKEAMRDKNNPNWKGGISKSKDYHKKKSREWRGNNRGYINFVNLRRVAIKKNAEGSHTFGEWELLKKQYGYKCPACEKIEPEIKLTQDHIIPLIKGGSDYIENIQPLCKNCNSKKHTNIIKY